MNPFSLAKDAVRLVWNHKVLWAFGFFIAGGAGGAVSRSHAAGAGGATPLWLWPAVGAALVLGLAFAVLHVAAEGALIDGARGSKAQEPVTLRSGFRAGFARFGAVLGVKALVVAMMLGITAVVLSPTLLTLLAGFKAVTTFALSGVLFLGAVPVLLSLHLTSIYALRIAVLEGAGPLEALRAARRYLSGRLLESLQVLVVSVVGQVGAGALAAAGLIPAAVVGGLTYAAFGLVPAIVAAAVLAAPVVAAALGALGAFRSTLWTLGFLESRAAERSEA